MANFPEPYDAIPRDPYPLGRLLSVILSENEEGSRGTPNELDSYSESDITNLSECFSDDDTESTSGTNVVAIDNKIEQAMDLVKSHLMYAVREEVEVLKEKIEGLEKKIFRLEWENGILRETAPPETLARIAAGYTGPAVAAATTVASSAPSTLPQGTVLNPPQLQQHLPPIVPPATGASVPTPSPNTGALPPEK